MRRWPPTTILVLAWLAAAFPASGAPGFTREPAVFDAQGSPYGLSHDCTLAAHNTCSGWIWVFNLIQGSVWGAILDPNDCPGGCVNGGCVRQVMMYSRCSTTPAQFGGIGMVHVDGIGCPTALVYESGPLTVVHCVSGDRWTTFDVEGGSTLGNPFAITITWGPQTAGVSNPQFATDNGVANLYCKQLGDVGFPGCATSSLTCTGWTIPPQNTFIYVADFNGDGTLDDICELYGAPYPLAFPYFYPYGYLPNNLIIGVGLDCSTPDCGGYSATEPSSWGRVKTLFQ